MKKSITAFLTVPLCLLLTLSAGCSKTFRTDYIKKYQAFLDYSLGADNWEVTGTGKGEIGYADFAYYYIWWTVGYTDAGGARRALYLDNYEKGAYASSFAGYVMRAARAAAADRLADALSGYPELAALDDGPYPPDLTQPPEEYKPDTAEPGLLLDVVHISGSYFGSFSAQEIVAAGSGIKLCDFDMSVLFEDGAYGVVLKGRLEDEARYRAVTASLYGDITAVLGRDVHLSADIYLYEPGSEEPAENFRQVWKDGEVQERESL